MGILSGHLHSPVRNFEEPVHLVHGTETDPCTVLYVSQDAACNLVVRLVVLNMKRRDWGRRVEMKERGSRKIAAVITVKE